MKWSIEIFSIIAGVISLLSMAIKTSTVKGSIYMRVTNIVACVFFLIYACFIPSISLIVLNSIVIIIHIYHLILLARDISKNKRIDK